MVNHKVAVLTTIGWYDSGIAISFRHDKPEPTDAPLLYRYRSQFSPAEDGEWVEVIRHAQSEQQRGAGAWFKVAPGSGMWVNVGRSLRTLFPDLNDARLPQSGVESDLAASMNFDYGPLQFLAFASGYGSLQFWSDGFESELVMVSQEAMIRGEGCCANCDLARRVFECGPGESGGCSTGIEVRSGWASKECHCDATRYVLNCA